MTMRTWRRSTRWHAAMAGVIAATMLAAPPNSPRLSAMTSSYHLVDGWPQASASRPMGYVSWVALDAAGLAYVFRRCPLRCADGTHPGASDPDASILVFDPRGAYVSEWEPQSGGSAKEGHSPTIDRHGFVWTTDVQRHIVRKYRGDGSLVLTLGTIGVAGATPTTFDKPTDVAVGADDSIFVADGYGNQRVVKFDAAGAFVAAWGRKGVGPGEFRIPHAVVQDRSGRIVVADRCGLGETKCTDGRIQFFDADGRFLTQWTPPGGAFAPMALAVDAADRLYIDDSQGSKIWILDGRSLRVLETVDDVSGHGMAVSRTGDDIYVTGSAAGVRRYTRRP